MEDGEVYEAHVYGRRERQSSRENVPLHGIAIDRDLALDERPLRVLEAGERPEATRKIVTTCPISGITTPIVPVNGELPVITGKTPAIEVGNTIHYLCSGGHILCTDLPVAIKKLVAALSGQIM